jgi:uncharacterized protein
MNDAIFLDASFWIASRDERDAEFRSARQITARIAQRGFLLVTTLLVAAETHAYFSRSAVRYAVLDDMDENPAIRIETLQPSDPSAGIRLLRQFKDKQFSLCDAVSFVVIERLGINRALSFDRHFRQYPNVQTISRPEDV